MRTAEIARPRSAALPRVRRGVPARRDSASAADDRKRRVPDRNELPSAGVFLVAPLLGLCIWIGLALLLL